MLCSFSLRQRSQLSVRQALLGLWLTEERQFLRLIFDYLNFLCWHDLTQGRFQEPQSLKQVD